MLTINTFIHPGFDVDSQYWSKYIAKFKKKAFVLISKVKKSNVHTSENTQTNIYRSFFDREHGTSQYPWTVALIKAMTMFASTNPFEEREAIL